MEKPGHFSVFVYIHWDRGLKMGLSRVNRDIGPRYIKVLNVTQQKLLSSDYHLNQAN